jgi:hypothetical protein
MSVATSEEIATELVELEVVERIVAESASPLDFRDVATIANLPEDRTNALLAKLRKQERVTATVNGSRAIYTPGKRCKVRVPVHAPLVVRRTSPVAEGYVDAKDAPAHDEPHAGNRGARGGDGTGKRLLDLLEKIDRPLGNGELADHAQIDAEKCERNMGYLARLGKVKREGRGMDSTWHRIGTPYPEDRLRMGHVDGEGPLIAKIRDDAPHAGMPHTLLPIVDTTEPQVAITADGELIILDGAVKSSLPPRIVRAIARLILKLNDGGLIVEAAAKGAELAA